MTLRLLYNHPLLPVTTATATTLSLGPLRMQDMASTAEKTKVFNRQEYVKEEGTTISVVHHDILRAHIFTRLGGPALATASCASSQMRLISNQQSLWSDICHATWPSTNAPRIHSLISTYPNGPRSFFSDTFPLLVFAPDQPSPSRDLRPPSPPTELISAVDLYYKDECIFSNVQETETLSSWFRCSPFRIDLLDPKGAIPTPIQSGGFRREDLEEDLRLSWIIVDPTGRRAANVSSRRAVSVQQHWLSGEIQLKFATVMAGDRRGPTEFVMCAAVVTIERCEVRRELRIQVREVSLQLENMDGASLNGKDSLEILQRAMRFGKRKKARIGEERERYEEYLKKKVQREEKKLRIEGILDSMCKAVGVAIVAAFCTCSLFFVLQ